MKKKLLAIVLVIMMMTTVLFACKTEPSGDPVYEDDITKKVDLKLAIALNDDLQRISYQVESPLDLTSIGGPYVVKGDIKPMWQYVAQQMNATFTDGVTGKMQSSELFSTHSANDFADAQIYGGSSASTSLMSWGTQGKFVNLKAYLDAGLMPNFERYLEENDGMQASITAYDGKMYYIPYVAEVGEFARNFVVDTDMIERLFANTPAQPLSTTVIPAANADQYQGFYVGNNARTGANGGTVTPKTGVNIIKEKSENIITIQNDLEVKSGANYLTALKQYIADNYDYDNPAELYVGAKAAYDIDELVALWRCIKYNPQTATGQSGATSDKVWPYFVRQPNYREELLRLATYFGGVKVHGTDAYGAPWYIDANGDLQYTYSQEGLYNVLLHLADIAAEGLIHQDMLSGGPTGNDANPKYRDTFWKGGSGANTTEFGFMTYDFLASSTAYSTNNPQKANPNVILPPVAKVNGVWQYYMDNSRVVKSDAWGISIAGTTPEQQARAVALFDYFFSEEGNIVQNYGMPYVLDSGTFTGPDGLNYPKYKAEALALLGLTAGADGSAALRQKLGVLLPIGYSKEIGFEYQYTVQNGFNGWKLLKESTVSFPTYPGAGLQPTSGGNPNYYKLTPSAYSFTARQVDALNTQTTIEGKGLEITNYLFNIIRKTGDRPANYAAYLKWFNDRGLETYVSTYQAAYNVTK